VRRRLCVDVSLPLGTEEIVRTAEIDEIAIIEASDVAEDEACGISLMTALCVGAAVAIVLITAEAEDVAPAETVAVDIQEGAEVNPVDVQRDAHGQGNGDVRPCVGQ
jgi:hypothetical protein